MAIQHQSGTKTRVRTIPVLGYWELGDICIYWVISVSGDIFLVCDTRCDMISKRRRPHDSHLNCLRERSSTAEHGEGSEGVGKKTKVQAMIHGR